VGLKNRAEQLFWLPDAFDGQDYGFCFADWIADEPLLMKPVHRFPIKTFSRSAVMIA